MHSSADELHVVLLWRGEELEALAPLILVEHEGIRRYELIGTRVLYEPTSVLTRSAEARSRLAEKIAYLKRPVLLMRLNDGGEFEQSLTRAARGRGVLLRLHTSGSPYVELKSSTWDTYHEGLPSRLKNVIRRGRRQLEKLGAVELKFAIPGPREVEPLLQQAFEIESRSWKGRRGSAVLLRPELRQFFFNYGTDAAARGELLVAFLQLGGRAIAMQVANVSCDAYWQLKIGYDEAYSKQLVGLQLQMETIRWAFERGLGRYEFLGTDEAWIREWTGNVRACRTLLYYPFSLPGMHALARDQLARLRTKLLRGRVRNGVPASGAGCVHTGNASQAFRAAV